MTTLHIADTGSDLNDGSFERPYRSVTAAMPKVSDGDAVRLRRGGVWPGGLSLPDLQHLDIGAYGDGPRPRFEVASGNGVNIIRPFERIEIRDIHLEAFDAPREAIKHGVRVAVQQSGALCVENCRVRGFSSNLSIKGPKWSYIEDNEILDAYDTVEHSQGIFVSHVANPIITGNLIDGNGWRADVAKRTVYNHGVYVTDKCGAAVVQYNVISNSSATGLQARSGGLIQYNQFIYDPIAMTFGYMLGNPPKTGGVSGEVAHNKVIEPIDMDLDLDPTNEERPSKLGFQFGNISDAGVDVHNNEFYGCARAIDIIIGNGLGVRRIKLASNIIEAERAFMFSSEMRESAIAAPYIGDVTIAGNTVKASTAVVILSEEADGYAFDPARWTMRANQCVFPKEAFAITLRKWGTRGTRPATREAWEAR